MQCKVLKFAHTEEPLKMETEINRWLAQGWKIESTTYVEAYHRHILIFLTK